ncbi:rhomboid family intramembrane serine protease [Flaviaesturariibacter aridisoli]|uniref:Rhomboid family intramembrane serine protease n=2 Tax=Flaviaesturariibacter aridisoli TaxID=2545761 RepID=A0A4V2WMY9_9BACT|nr:rhomboid family intramembrane serine protease [Flaviaesturariibacter aridisoli]
MTIGIMILTVLVSIGAFSSPKIMEDLIFYPPAVGRGQWYRFFTSGLIHADYFHLGFNMYALFLFGRNVELAFGYIFGDYGKWVYLLLYVLALLAALLPTYNRNKDNYAYRGLGASGAVSAVIFASILIDPTAKMGLIFIPVLVPGFVFGPLYLLVSTYLDKRGGGNVNHSAHIWGALFGIGFLILACRMVEFPIVQSFLQEVKRYRWG